MLHNLKPYPAYKDSGVPWLGEVPEHWDVKRNKLFMREINERSEDGSEELLTVSQYTGVTARRERISEENGLLTNAASLVGYKRVNPGDLVMNIMLAWNGSLGVSPIAGIASPAYCVYRVTEKIEPRFLHYLFRTPLFTGVFKAVSTGVVDSRLRLYPEVFFRLISILPPKEEQSAIIHYLDYIARRIRRYIRAKQKLIKLLEEQKQAIIHQAVTRGLDPNVKLKPSGVEWLGDVPEHWEVRKLKFEVTFTGGGTPSKANAEFWTGDIPWVSPKDMKTSVIRDTEDHISTSAVAESATKLIDPGAVLVVVRSGILRRKIPVAINNVSVAINQDMKALGSKGRLHNEYIFALIEGCQKILLTEWTKQGATVESIEHELMANSFIPIPPKNEQLAIVHFLNKANKNIDSVIAKTHQEISLLREYRTRLIADVVTGKLDVREAAANLPEETDETEALDEELAEDEETTEEEIDCEIEEE